MGHLSHEMVRDLLAGAALEALDAGERALALDHVASCADCAEQLIEYREVLALLGGTLVPPREVSADRASRLRDRLIARAVADRRATIREASDGGRLVAALSNRWTGWAVATGLGSVLLLHHGFHRPVDAGWIAAGVVSLAAVALGMYAAVQRRRVAALRAELESRPAPSLHPPR